MRRPLSLAEFGGCGLRERLVRSSVRCTKRAPTSSDSRRRYVVVVASAGIPAGFFEIGPLSRASRRAKVPSVANVEESVVEATLREFFVAVRDGKDAESSWKKQIYKVIARYDEPIPEYFKTQEFLKQLVQQMPHEQMSEHAKPSSGQRI